MEMQALHMGKEGWIQVITLSRKIESVHCSDVFHKYLLMLYSLPDSWLDTVLMERKYIQSVTQGIFLSQEQIILYHLRLEVSQYRENS